MPIELLATKLAQASGAFSPQHKSNWSIEIEGVDGMEDIALSLATGFNPKVELDKGTIPFGNSEVYYAGKSRFGAGSLVVRDYIDRDIAGVMAAWFAQAMPGLFDETDGRIGVPADYKKDGHVLNFGPDGEGLRQWKLIGVWLQTFDGGDLDMATSDQVTVNATVVYDWAVYEGSQPGLN